jgi:hypothetical protein
MYPKFGFLVWKYTIWQTLLLSLYSLLLIAGFCGSVFCQWLPSHMFRHNYVQLANRRGHRIRDARWFDFKPKIPNWVNFGGSCIGKCWYILWPFRLFLQLLEIIGIFGDHLVYFSTFWYVVPRKIWQPCTGSIFHSIHSMREKQWPNFVAYSSEPVNVNVKCFIFQKVIKS